MIMIINFHGSYNFYSIVVPTSQSEVETVQVGSHSSQAERNDVKRNNQVVGMCIYQLQFYLMSMNNIILYFLLDTYLYIQNVK